MCKYVYAHHLHVSTLKSQQGRPRPPHITSDLQHGLVPTVQDLQDGWNLLLGLQQQGFEIHQH